MARNANGSTKLLPGAVQVPIIYKRGEGGYWGLVLHESKNIFGNPDVVVPTRNEDVLLQ